MKFRTELKPIKTDLVLSAERPFVTLGSCFADEISSRMRHSLWDAGNPLGVLFNPLSIAKAIELMLFTEHPEQAFSETLFESSGIIHSWLFDSSASAMSKKEAIEKFAARRQKFESMIYAGRCLSITFGTSFCYFLADRPGFTVANCHKQPASMFTRRRVETDEIAGLWSGLVRKLREKISGMEIIFTVSPVRHVRDGLHENQLSKATLLLATDRICREYPFCHYFPSYEIVNDDLRDYRFYASDLVHPSDSAVEYIWEIFKDTYLDADGLEFVKEGASIVRRLNHRPILASETTADEFRRETERIYADFCRRHPGCLRH